jgi:hypothetical protein
VGKVSDVFGNNKGEDLESEGAHSSGSHYKGHPGFPITIGDNTTETYSYYVPADKMYVYTPFLHPSEDMKTL